MTTETKVTTNGAQQQAELEAAIAAMNRKLSHLPAGWRRVQIDRGAAGTFSATVVY